MIRAAHLKRLLPLAGVVVLGAALVVLHRTLSGYRYRDIVEAVAGIPGWRIAVALAVTAANYVLLAGYEQAAVRAVGYRLGLLRTGMAAFVAYSFSHNIGYAAVSGGAVRYRFYSRWGLRPVDIAYVILLGGGAFWAGFAVVAGVTLLAMEPTPQLAKILPPHLMRPAGAICLAAAIAVWGLAFARKRDFTIRGMTLRPPPRRDVLQLLVVSVADWAMVAAVIWILLPPGSVSYAHFLAVFLISQAAGMVSQVPGGLGVVEATLLVTLGEDVDKPQLMAALIVYRLVYHLLPFTLAAALMIGQELSLQRHRMAAVADALGRVARPVVAPACAVLAFTAGAMLVVAGALPPDHSRLRLLGEHVPRAAIDVAHVLASATGLGLMIAARALLLRLRGGWWAACALLVLAVPLALLKGLAAGQATILFGVLLLLLPLRADFARRRRLQAHHFDVRWTAAIAAVVLSSLWLMVFCFKQLEDTAGWLPRLSFETRGDAARALRATVGAAGLLVAATVWWASARVVRGAHRRLTHRHGTSPGDASDAGAAKDDDERR